MTDDVIRKLSADLKAAREKPLRVEANLKRQIEILWHEHLGLYGNRPACGDGEVMGLVAEMLALLRAVPS